MDHDNKKIGKKIVLDICLLLLGQYTNLRLLGIPVLIFFLRGKPTERGFFCDDESLKHPFHPSTVPSYYLYVYGLAVPIVLMIIIEWLHWRNEKVAIKLGCFEIPYWAWKAYCAILIFGFGAVCSQLLTDIMKYNVGRLRPHFFDVCDPDTDCTLEKNKHLYIQNFTCKNTGNDRLLKEMRLSFPSGHSSFSMYTMFYIAIYLQARWKWRSLFLLRNTIQYGSILLAVYTGMTRIKDYKHHWSDVLIGLLLGIFVAVLVGRYVSDLFSNKQSRTLLPTNYSDTEMPIRNGTSQN